jgi:acetylornithine aminotransferase
VPRARPVLAPPAPLFGATHSTHLLHPTPPHLVKQGLPGAVTVPFRSLEAAAAAVKKGRTAAVFVEPVQGEGGINAAGAEFLGGLRRLCDDAGALLVFDEVQCGLGRTGRLWAHEAAGVAPDMMTLAKPLAGGLPIGAVLLTQRVADAIAPGDHGSTFAGNPLCCAAAVATFDVIAEPAFLADVVRKGEALTAGLRAALAGVEGAVEVRGAGLLVGVQLTAPAGPVVEAARRRGLLVITAGAGDVVRLAPPLTVTDAEIGRACALLGEAVREALAG